MASYRLQKVAKDFNVGIQTLVGFLAKKGHQVEMNPNTKISEEQYELLAAAFQSERKVKEEAEKIELTAGGANQVVEAGSKAVVEDEPEVVIIKSFTSTKPIAPKPQEQTSAQHQDSEPKEQPASEPQVEEPAEVRPAEKEVEAPAPKVEAEPEVEKRPAEQPVNIQPEEADEPEPEPAEPEDIEGSDDIEPEPVQDSNSPLKVVGTVDLSAINQRMRPDKKKRRRGEKKQGENKPAAQQSGNQATQQTGCPATQPPGHQASRTAETRT